MASMVELIRQDPILVRLDAALQTAAQTYPQNPEITLIQAVTDMNLIKQVMQVYGFVVIKDVYTEEDMIYNYQQVIRELSLYLFQIENPHQNAVFETEYQRISAKYPNLLNVEKELATLTLWWNSSGGFGNSSFRFLLHQYVEESQATRFNINGKEIWFTWNPYHRIALRVMTRYPDIWNILKSLHPNKEVMLSWDSQKVRFHEIGRGQTKNKDLGATQPTLTERHRDLYGDVERTQGMFIRDNPESIHLGFVKFTNQPYIKAIIEQYMGSFGIAKNGFSKIGTKPALEYLLDKYWLPVSNGFVIWSTDTFHYEGLNRVNGEFSTGNYQKHLDLFSNRLATGVHVVYNLVLEERLQLAVCSEYGFQPEIYGSRNKGTMVDKNVVDRKTTQYKVARSKRTYEIYNEQHCRQALADGSGANYIMSLHPMYREMYGIYSK